MKAFNFENVPEQYRANARRVNAPVEEDFGPDFVQILPVHRADDENH